MESSRMIEVITLRKHGPDTNATSLSPPDVNTRARGMEEKGEPIPEGSRDRSGEENKAFFSKRIRSIWTDQKVPETKCGNIHGWRGKEVIVKNETESEPMISTYLAEVFILPRPAPSRPAPPNPASKIHPALETGGSLADSSWPSVPPPAAPARR